MSRSVSLVALGLAAALVALHPGGLFRSAGDPFEPPSTRHWFGTDDLGRDVFEGVVLGARLSLLVALGTMAMALFLGAGFGLLSGYAGGFADGLASRVTELFQIFPRFFLALTVMTLWEPSVPLLVLVLGSTSWSGLARIARAEAMTLREREFVVSARASGASRFEVVTRHLLPAIMRPLLAASPLVGAQSMLAEAGLAFLGMGAPEGVSWGYLLRNAQPFLRQAWWMAIFPGLAMSGAVFALSLQSVSPWGARSSGRSRSSPSSPPPSVPGSTPPCSA